MDGVVVRLRHPHDLDDVRADVFVNVSAKTDVPKVFNKNPALDVVGVKLADTAEFTE